ncbi:MAG: GGDEF domain-containing protein [Candidatus Omnitrophota bacterium]|nr:GGDEF domain-containing protein [Candidatus Omnitrophota bacterium]
MVYVLIILTVIFVAVVFFLVKVIVLQMEQASDQDVLRSKETYQKIIDRQARVLAEKARLEREAAQIFTLYEMTKEINRHFNEQEAFNIFKRRLRENITIGDCQLVDNLGEGSEAPQGAPGDQTVFVLKSREKKLGFLVAQGVAPKDKEKFAILAHQFALAYQRIKLYKDIETLAITDGLTAVSTRRYFLERFDEEIKRAQARKIKMSFLMLDVDHFKTINDRHGHLTGDAVLKEIGVIIKENIREIDIAGRYGGEEFCVVLPDTDLEGARVVAERIRKAAETRIIKAYDAVLSITVSIGVSTYPSDGDLPEELIDKADWSLYRAKSQGRNCVVAFGMYHPPDPAS